MKTQKLAYISILSIITVSAFAQKGGIGNEEIVITKERNVVLPQANRVYEKIPPVQNPMQDREMKYNFVERKPTGIEEVKFNPNVIPPEGGKKTEVEKFNNYIRLGAGNYGRLYGETFLNTNQEGSLVLGLHALHNSTSKGPVDLKNSATRNNLVALNGKYVTPKFAIKADGSWEHRNMFFYGYGGEPSVDFDRENYRQKFNIFKFGVGFENITPQPRVDYALKTNIRTIKDNYEADELEWATNFNASFPIVGEKFVALVDADAFMTQRSDLNISGNRNLFRVHPSFKVNLNRFGAEIGYKALSEYDSFNKVERSKGFPTIELTYKMPNVVYFFAGMDGDIIRNTFGSYIEENPFLAPEFNLLNTEKMREFYVGTKGDLGGGFSFNVRGAFGFYKNLYLFNNKNFLEVDDIQNGLAVSKFEVLYDSLKTEYFNISTQLNYSPVEMWRTYLRGEFYNYKTKTYQHAFYRPNFTGKWGNTLVVSEKLVANLDLFFIGSTYAQNLLTEKEYKIKPIWDLNAEFDYLFSKQFTAFVKLNNIIGQKYQRFLYYPNQGLNFLVGINLSF
ncbi:MAG: TonB-dependent receptor [Spirosomataceae bacterium]